ncbi:CBM35 domain-containing protein [Streptomyces sp. 3214.6]|uniref:CBM35 domain-containing protein n=1 Tax=Streptomyces sp. 3214.6 TaxID=1882757 RepID=UPI000909FA0A|nr:CBM35 domain-containing protein [Streptomyces sp. 3214.6]SHI18101.1 Carbohydrate binding module (family 35) [Streptomyces sp. 3214.6]
MTPGNNGASTPEDDDPFGYLYADGQANGAQPPSGGGYGYPNSVNRVRAVGERQYGQPQQPQQQTAQYGQYGQPPTVPQQQGGYGQPNAHYAAPENFGAGGPSTGRQPAQGGGGGRSRGPNTKGLLIGAVAVVAAVVIGIVVVMTNGDSDKKDDNKAGGQTSSSASAPQSPSPSASASDDASKGDLPAIDAKALSLEGGTALASNVKGAKAAGGTYVGNFNHVGAAVTWNVSGIPEDGKYTLYVTYGVPGKDGNATLTINGTAQGRPLSMKNFAHAPEGDYEKGWTNTWGNITLNKGTNTIKISCEQGNSCDANLDQLSLQAGWK